jgi:hypothetical protein
MTCNEIGESALFPPFDTCPGCRGRGLRVMAVLDQANFFCPACRSCWHVDLGWVHRVTPAACASCARRSQCQADSAEPAILQ